MHVNSLERVSARCGLSSMIRSSIWPAAALAAAHALLGLSFFLPHDYTLESTYLINVHALAGTPGNFFNSLPIGYSLLLTPALLLARPLALYYFAILVNALGLGWLCHALTKFAKNAGARHPLLIALAASSYPTLWVYANHAVPETVLTLVVTLMFLIMVQYQQKARPGFLLLFALLAAASWPLHLRMVLFAQAGIVFAVYLLLTRHRSWRWALAAGAGGVAIIVLSIWAKAYTNQVETLSGIRIDPVYDRVGRDTAELIGATPFRALWNVLSAMTGQLWYLAMATVGIVPVALYQLAVRLRGQLRTRAFHQSDLFLGGALLATLVVASGQKMLMQNRFHIVFGRYLDIFAPLLLVQGLMFLEKLDLSSVAARRRAYQAFGLLGVASLGCFALALPQYLKIPEMVIAHRFTNSTGLGGYYLLFGGVKLPLFLPATLAVSLAAFLLLLKIRRKAALFGVMTLFFLGESSVLLYSLYNSDVAPQLEGIAKLDALMAEPRLRAVRCINYPTRQMSGFIWNFAIRYPDKVIQFVDLGGEHPDRCGDYFWVFSITELLPRFPKSCHVGSVTIDHSFSLINVAGDCPR